MDVENPLAFLSLWCLRKNTSELLPRFYFLHIKINNQLANARHSSAGEDHSSIALILKAVLEVQDQLVFYNIFLMS